MDIKYILLNGDWGNILHFPLEGWFKPCFFCDRPTGRSYIYNNYKLFCCKDCFPQKKLKNKKELKKIIEKK